MYTSAYDICSMFVSDNIIAGFGYQSDLWGGYVNVEPDRQVNSVTLFDSDFQRIEANVSKSKPVELTYVLIRVKSFSQVDAMNKIYDIANFFDDRKNFNNLGTFSCTYQGIMRVDGPNFVEKNSEEMYIFMTQVKVIRQRK